MQFVPRDATLSWDVPCVMPTFTSPFWDDFSPALAGVYELLDRLDSIVSRLTEITTAPDDGGVDAAAPAQVDDVVSVRRAARSVLISSAPGGARREASGR